MAKTAIPISTSNGRSSIIADHFGRSELFYIIVDENDPSQDEIVNNRGNHFGGSITTPEFLVNLGIDTVISKGMGRKAITAFEESQISVYKSKFDNIEDTLEEMVKGNLSLLTQPCERSQHHH